MSGKGFDPDAFLAETAAPTAAFDPDAFLAKLEGKHTPAPGEVAEGLKGSGSSFLHTAADALPLGRPVANALTALGLSAFGPKAGAKLTPQAAKELGMPQEAAQPGLVDNYRSARDVFSQRTAAGKEANPWASGAGTVAGTALSLLAPLPKAAVGTGAAGRIASNALTGGAYGALNAAVNGKADLTKGEVGQALKDVVGVEGLQQAGADWGEGKKLRALLDVMGAGGVGGALTGGALGGVTEWLRKPVSNALTSASGRLQSFANRKALNALGAMKPELNALGSEGAQAVGQFANDAGIVSPLASRATMAERIEALRKTAGGKLSGALGELDALAAPGERINSADAARKVEELAAETARKPALRNIANKFSNEADNIRASTIAGESPGGSTLRDFEEVVARPYKQTTNWNADLALPKETLKQLPRALEAEVERAAETIAKRTGSDALDRYRAAKGDYANLAELKDIAEEGLKRQASNHTFSLKDAMYAAPAAMAGIGHGSMGSLVAGGLGVGASKLANRFGDQMSAASARSLAKILRQAPELAGDAVGTLLSNAPAAAPNAVTPDSRLQLALAHALRGDINL